MKNFILVFLIVGTFIGFSACKKNGSGPATLSGPYLFVGGTTTLGSSKAVYWKISLSQPGYDATPHTVLNSTNVTDILSSGKDVYMAAQTGGYWKNDTFHVLPSASFIKHLNLSASAVYAAGWDNSNRPAYWAGDAKITLDSPDSRTLFPYASVATVDINGIALSGSNVYVAGSLFVENLSANPVNAIDGNFGLLWTNGSLRRLGSGVLPIAFYPSAAGVAVSGTDVYVAGRFPDSTEAGGYWKNGNWNSINNGAFIPSSIVIVGGNAYISGSTFIGTPPSYSQRAAYWVNGNLMPLNGTTAIGVAVYGTDVYVLGIDNNNNVVVWKNGTLFETIGSAGGASADCIAIGG